jgi:hypothetical protein
VLTEALTEAGVTVDDLEAALLLPITKRFHRFGVLLFATLTISVLSSDLRGQDPKAALQQRLASIKESIAENQAALRQYSWTETTEVSLKGEVKSRQQNECRYGPDGEVVKTPLGERREPKNRRGLRGRIVENKVGELKDYLDRAGSLIRRYVPPDPGRMTETFQAGKASLNRDAASGGAVVFTDYVKPGDQMTLDFQQGAIRSVTVKTYLDEPSDAVNLSLSFQTLPNGPNYLAETVLDATARHIQIRTTNFDHQR